MCAPLLCCVAGGPEASVKGVEVIRQAVCGADGAAGCPVMRCRPYHILPEPAVE